MPAHRERRRFTAEEYLALEERSSTRSEFYQGEIYATSGGSIEHNRLVRNLTLQLGSALEGGPWELFAADLRLYIAEHDLFTYPDLFVVCGALSRLRGRKDTLTDAGLIAEVLSPTTEVYDRGEKFLFYQSLPSLREYLLVRQDRAEVEHHTREAPGQWRSTTIRQGRVALPSLGIVIDLEGLYRGVELPG